jgi:hypothetical protein
MLFVLLFVESEQIAYFLVESLKNTNLYIYTVTLLSNYCGKKLKLQKYANVFWRVLFKTKCIFDLSFGRKRRLIFESNAQKLKHIGMLFIVF